MKWVKSKICLPDSTCTSKSFFFCPKRGQCGKWKQKNIIQMAWQSNVFQFLAYKPPTYVLYKNVITVTCRGAFYLSINLLLTSYTCACHVHTESLHGQHLDKLDFWSGTYAPNLKAEEIMGLESLITKECYLPLLNRVPNIVNSLYIIHLEQNPLANCFFDYKIVI